jgi:hypothetical protein
MVDYGRRFMERRGAEADARREANLQAFRNQQRDMQTGDVPGNQAAGRPSPDAIARMAEIDAQGRDVPGNRAMSPPPRPRPRPAPAPRRELTMEEIRALRSGERAPRTSEERALREGLRDLPQRREMTAEELNEREYQRVLAARAAEEEAARQMGGSGNIGAASARERGEQVGPFGDYNLKKGGIVKKKAGGMIKAAPKKMMKGGVVAKPKAATKAKAKPMPAFKKGGVTKKGKK